MLRNTLILCCVAYGACSILPAEEVIWEYNSANISSQHVTAFNDAAHSRLASGDKRFGVPNRPTRRQNLFPSTSISATTRLRLMGRHNYGQEIDPTSKKMRFTQSLFRKSRATSDIVSDSTQTPNQLYWSNSCDWHCLINADGPKFNQTRLPEETAYEITFDVDIVDSYPAAWSEIKWWEKLSTVTGGYAYVLQLWHDRPGSPPLIVGLDRGVRSSGQEVTFWQCTQRYHDENGNIAFVTNNIPYLAAATFHGPGVHRFKIRTDVRPSGKGFTEVQMKGPNHSDFITIANFTNIPTYYRRKPLPGGDVRLPKVDFGIYATVNNHNELMSKVDADSDKIPNYADADWDNDGTSDARWWHPTGGSGSWYTPADSDSDGVHDLADADSNANGFRETDKPDFEYYTNLSLPYAQQKEAYQKYYVAGTTPIDHRGMGINDIWARATSDSDGDGIPDFADVAFADASNTGTKPEYQLPSNAIDIEGDGVFHEQIQLIYDNIRISKYTPGDLNFDGEVNFADFLVQSQNYGQDGDWRKGDCTGDGQIDFADFLVLGRNWTP